MQTATNLSKTDCFSPKLQDYQARLLKVFTSNSFVLETNSRHSKSLALWSYVLCRAAQTGEIETVYSKDGAVSLAALLRSLGFEARAYRNFVRGRIAIGKFSLKVKTV